MQAASNNFGSGNKSSSTANVVWGKFFTDATIGLDWNSFDFRSKDDEELKLKALPAEYRRGRVVPQLRQQYICGAPSVLAEDYEDLDTQFGEISAQALAQLAPLYVNLQSYALKNFATRS